MNATKTLTSVFMLLVFFGILGMVLKNPIGASAIVQATAGTVAGVMADVEGRG